MSLQIQDTTYAGEAASGFIVKAMTEFPTVQNGHAYVQDGIKKEFTIPRFQLDDIIQDRAATPNSQGTVKIDGQKLIPNDYMIYMEFNPRDFEAHWEAVNMNPELLDAALPSAVESVLIQEVLKRNNNYLEKAFWQSAVGGTAPYDKWDGMITKFIASADVLKVPGASYAALTASNIIAKMGLVRDLIPEALIDDPNMKLFVSKGTAKLYGDAQKAQTAKGVDVTQRGVYQFDGYEVVPLPGIPANVIIAAKGMADMESNLWMGVNSKADETYIQLARLQANSELWFVKALVKADVNFGWGEETVLYHPSNP